MGKLRKDCKQSEHWVLNKLKSGKKISVLGYKVYLHNNRKSPTKTIDGRFNAIQNLLHRGDVRKGNGGVLELV